VQGARRLIGCILDAGHITWCMMHAWCWEEGTSFGTGYMLGAGYRTHCRVQDVMLVAGCMMYHWVQSGCRTYHWVQSRCKKYHWVQSRCKKYHWVRDICWVKGAGGITGCRTYAGSRVPGVSLSAVWARDVPLGAIWFEDVSPGACLACLSVSLGARCMLDAV
jgi:hypothetical protein